MGPKLLAMVDYYSLRGESVARALEALMVVAAGTRQKMRARFGLDCYAPRKSSASLLKERASAMSAAVD
jgi:hypothetical protein